MLGWLGRVHSIAFPTTIALAPRRIEACFVLLPVRLALWTVHNAYSILFSFLGTLIHHGEALGDIIFNNFNAIKDDTRLKTILTGLSDWIDE